MAANPRYLAQRSYTTVSDFKHDETFLGLEAIVWRWKVSADTIGYNFCLFLRLLLCLNES